MDIENQNFEDNTVSKFVDEFPGFDQKQKLIMASSGNEILVDLNISILIKDPNDQEAFPENRQVYNNNYWIPIPSGHNIEEYVLAFLKNFENSMSKSIE